MLRKIFVVAFISLSCDEVVIEPTNPLDPNNPDYIEPQINILYPTDNATINSSSITFTWEGNRDGMLFRYAVSLDTGGNSGEWSDWSHDKSVQVHYFDEGLYSFSAQSKYTTGDSSSISNISFEVDAVEGPSLLFKPRAQRVELNERFFFNVIAEEVDSLTATSFTLKYNPDELIIGTVTKGSFFEAASNMIFHHDINQLAGEITIITALLGGEIPMVTGTGSLAEIEVFAKSFSEAKIEFDGSETFRGPSNNIITIKFAIGGLVMQ